MDAGMAARVARWPNTALTVIEHGKRARKPHLDAALSPLPSDDLILGLRYQDDVVRVGDGPAHLDEDAQAFGEREVARSAVCDQVVAVDDQSDYPEEVLELPRDLSGFEPNVEAIASYETAVKLNPMAVATAGNPASATIAAVNESHTLGRMSGLSDT